MGTTNINSRFLKKIVSPCVFVVIILTFWRADFWLRKKNVSPLLNYFKKNSLHQPGATSVMLSVPFSRNLFENDSRIFMHETSGRSYLLWRQTCSLESVARSNPNRLIQVYMSTKSLDAKSPWIGVTRQFRNIEILLVDNEEYFKGSRLEAWYGKKNWQNSRFEISHMSNYIRMVTLSRGGGLYLDLDMILFKELKEEIFKNVFFYSTAEQNFVDSSIFHLETGHHLIDEITDLIASEYDREADIYHGSDAVSKVLKDVCRVEAHDSTSNKCKDITIMPQSYFNAIEEYDWKQFFRETNNSVFWNIIQSYGIHTLLSLTNKKMADLDSSQLLALLANKYCPLTVSQALLYHNRKI